MAVLAFDDVVLTDLAIPCDVVGRVRNPDGQPLYDVRVCGVRREIRSEHLSLEVPWRLSTLQRASTIIVPGIYRVDRLVPEGNRFRPGSFREPDFATAYRKADVGRFVASGDRACERYCFGQRQRKHQRLGKIPTLAPL